MKFRITKLLFATVLAAGLLVSCTDDLQKAVVESNVRSRGPRLASSLSVEPIEDPMTTKSTFTGNDAAVAEWSLLQFDTADGKLVAKYHIASGEDISNIEVVPGHPYHWFAVANCGDVRGNFTLGTTTISSMASWVVEGLDIAAAQTKGALPMAWTSTSGTPAGIGFSREQIQQGAVLDIPLKRLVAKYDISIVRSGLSKYTYTVDNARLVGPTAVKPFDTNTATAVVTGADMATTTGTDSDKAKLNSGAAATFYALENLYGEKAITDTWQKKPKNLGEDDRPTYVEILGKASGNGLTDVPITYRFFLGTNATSNFDVIRNTANIITLTLSDTAIDQAIQEADDNPTDPPVDPLWKIEAGHYDDSRLLQFQDGIAVGGAGLNVPSGAYTPEPITRNPEDLNYRFKLDAALYDGGVRVFYDNAGASEIPAGYGSDWVTLSGSPATLYFFIPSGSPAVTGQAHIISLDGRKYDDLVVKAGRVLTKLRMQTGTLNNTASGQSFGAWNEWYYESECEPQQNGTSTDFRLAHLACDTVFVQVLQGEAAAQWGAGYAMRVFAVYSDGTETLLKADFNTAPYFTWSSDYNEMFTNTLATGVSYGYGNFNAARFWQIGTTSQVYNDKTRRNVRLQYSGTGLYTLSYTENGITKELYVRTRVHCGVLQANPSSTTSSRIDVPLAGAADITYWWRDNNGKGGQDNLGGVDITSIVAPNITVTAGGDYLRYDGLTAGKAHFSGKGAAGEAQATVGGTGYISYADILTAFGDNPQKGRSATIPSSAGIAATGSSASPQGNFDEFRYSFFRVYDDRVLDHLELFPSKAYGPRVGGDNPQGGNEDKLLKLYAHFTDGTMEDISTDASVVWNLAPGDFSTSSYARGNGVVFYNSYYGNNYYSVVHINSSSLFTNDGEYKKVPIHRSNVRYANTLSPWSTWGYVTASSPQPLFSADYTFNGVTKSASFMITLVDDRQPQSLLVAPATQNVYVGGKPVSLTATVTYDDGTTTDVTAAATWSNDSQGLLTNNGGGSYTSQATPGTTTLNATYTMNAVAVTSNTATVNVLPRTVTGVELQVKPAGASDFTTGNKTVSVESDQQWRIKVTYEDGGDPDYITTGFQLSSSDATKLSVNTSTNPLSTHAEAVGSSNVTATYQGVSSSNTVTITIEDHNYTYELITSRAYPGYSNLSLEDIRDDAGSGSIDWDGADYFYAYYVRYDNGVLDNAFGTGSHAGKPFRDVTDDATWSCESVLTASNVGSFNATTQRYTANNTSGSNKTGDITAEYAGLSSDYTLTVRKYVEPALSASPTDLIWSWDQSGSGDQKTVTVSATNTTWSVKSVSDHFAYTKSGNTLQIYPKTQNTGDSDITGTLVIEGTNGVSDVVINLTHCAWNHDPDGLYREITDVYIAREGSTTKLTSDVISAASNQAYNLVVEYRFRYGTSGAWNENQHEIVAGGSLDWSLSSTQYASLSTTADNHKDATVNNGNTSGSSQTVTLTAHTVGTWGNGSKSNSNIWLPAEFSYILTKTDHPASVTITLENSDTPIYRVVISPSGTQTLEDGGTVALTAKLQERVNGGSWTDVTTNASDWSWSSANTSVATVSPNSGSKTTTVTGHNGDTGSSYKETDVTATYNGTQHGSSVSESESVTIRVNDQAPIITQYRIVTSVSPASIAWNGTSTASAMLQSRTSTDGGSTWGSWTDVRNVTSNVTFTKGGSGAAVISIAGSGITANNAGAATTATVNASGYTGTETIEDYVQATLTIGAKPSPSWVYTKIWFDLDEDKDGVQDSGEDIYNVNRIVNNDAVSGCSFSVWAIRHDQNGVEPDEEMDVTALCSYTAPVTVNKSTGTLENGSSAVNSGTITATLGSLSASWGVKAVEIPRPTSVDGSFRDGSQTQNGGIVELEGQIGYFFSEPHSVTLHYSDLTLVRKDSNLTVEHVAESAGQDDLRLIVSSGSSATATFRWTLPNGLYLTMTMTVQSHTTGNASLSVDYE